MALKDTRKEILAQITDNQNVCIPKEIKEKLEKGIVYIRDLEDAGIPEDIIPHIFTYSEPGLESTQHTNPEQIKEQGILEAYFWGWKTSGKTCALAGILKTIQNEGHFKSASNCYNEEYLQSLKDKIVHNDHIAYFPNRTPGGEISYMNFNLIRENFIKRKNIFGKEKIKQKIATRKVAFIDLSGELIKYIVENKERSENSGIDSINTLKKLLNNSYNRKIHFFFVDYDNENKAVNQVSKLEQLMTIFRDVRYFDKTDFIYIVITKSDTFKDKEGNPIPKNKRRDFAKDFFNNKCRGLRTNIIDICTNKSGKGINMDRQGIVDLNKYILDFSMGEVYFQRLCKFDASSAKEIEQILFSKVNSTDELYG